MARLNRISYERISLGTLVAVVMALLAGAVACSKSSTREASSTTNAKEASSGTKTALPPVDLKGPILAVVMASSIDDKGQPVNPRFTFPPDERQLTMIVQVGQITGSPLDITWYKTSDDGDQKLFQHTVEVKTYDRAFSIGKNRGRLAPGSYKAAVTLEGHTREVEFDIAAKGKTAPESAPRDPKDNSQRDRGSESAQGSPPISGGSGIAPRPSAPAGAAKDRYPWQQDRPDLKDCRVDKYTFAVSDPDLDSPTVSVIAGNGCLDSATGYSAPPGPVRVEAKIDGKPTLLSAFEGGEYFGEYRVDPCSLDRGSDLPGTKVKFRAVAANDLSVKAETSITLGDDTLAPRVQTISSIKRGTKVKEGDRITLDVTAQEKRRNGPWQTGVKIIQVTAEPGGLVDKPWTNPSNLPKPCDQKTWSQQYKATYTVPKNPPPIIRICSIAEDYQGNQSSQCGEFPTGDVWKGTLHAKSSQFWVSVDGSAQCLNEEWDIDLELVVAGDGSVTGNGSGQLVSMPKCSSSPSGLPFGLELEGHAISCPDIRGRFDGKEFQLQFPNAIPDGGTLGGILSLSGEPPGHNTPTLRAQVIGQGMARGQTETDVPINEAAERRHAKGVFDITLKCTTCSNQKFAAR